LEAKIVLLALNRRGRFQIKLRLQAVCGFRAGSRAYVCSLWGDPRRRSAQRL